MIAPHIFLGGKLMSTTTLHDTPRVGDTVRFSDESYGTVLEVIWCLDEISPLGSRVNIWTEEIGRAM